MLNWSPDGWDAADAIAEWPSIEALRAEAFRLAKPSDLGPAYVSHGQFHMRSHGLWCEAPHKSKNSDDVESERLEIWVSGPFEILGRVRDNHGGEWARLLRWNDEDGREHVETVRDADLHGEASALAAKLAHGGLKTARASWRKAVAYLNGADVRARITSVDRAGWHVVADRSLFVLPSGPIGAPSGETVILQGGAMAAYSVKGTLEAWRETVGQKIAGHSRAVLAVSVAFAGPLALDWTGWLRHPPVRVLVDRKDDPASAWGASVAGSSLVSEAVASYRQRSRRVCGACDRRVFRVSTKLGPLIGARRWSGT